MPPREPLENCTCRLPFHELQGISRMLLEEQSGTQPMEMWWLAKSKLPSSNNSTGFDLKTTVH